MPNNPELTRAFICLSFPNEIIKEIARIQSLVKKQKFTGKLTELENLHLTLKFLGEITQETLEKVKALLQTISFPKPELKLGPAGLFSHRGKPSIVWIKLEGKSVFSLQEQIDQVLSPLFPKEERFMSHLTIARIKYVKDKIAFKSTIQSIKPKPLKFTVSSFKLMSSTLQPQGPIYKALEKYQSSN